MRQHPELSSGLLNRPPRFEMMAPISVQPKARPRVARPLFFPRRFCIVYIFLLLGRRASGLGEIHFWLCPCPVEGYGAKDSVARER